jgi:hypothetical protein
MRAKKLLQEDDFQLVITLAKHSLHFALSI